MIALDELRKLPPEDKLELVTALWDSLADRGEGLPAESPAFIAEVLRRDEEYRNDPASGVAWEGVEARILKRRA